MAAWHPIFNASEHVEPLKEDEGALVSTVS